MSDTLIHIRTSEYPVTEAEFAARFPRLNPPYERYYAVKGYAKVYPSAPPEYDAATQYVTEIAPERNENRTWRQKWEVQEYDPVERLAEIRAAKIAAIDALRDAKIAAGVPFEFPDGPGTVQTRDLIDARNIQANVTTAQILAAMGETNPVMVFRDQENANHAMTPAQMLALGVGVASAGQAVYSASWVHKDAVEQLQTIAEITEYDITGGWPD